MALAPSPLAFGIGWNFGIGQSRNLTPQGPLEVAGTPVTTATVDTPYAGFTVQASGGVAPYHFTVYTGQLPTGITLHPQTGVVSGTPTVAETQTGIQIHVTDALNVSAYLAPFGIAVSASPPPSTNNVVYLTDLVTYNGDQVVYTPE